MAALQSRPSGLVAWLAKWSPAFAVLTITAALAIIATDHYLGLIGGLSVRGLKRIGKGFGELGASLALLSIAYYLAREVYVRLVARAGVMAAAGPVKAVLGLLRHTHPPAGALAFAIAAFHGYTLWSGRFIIDDTTGLAALGVLAFLACSGLLLAASDRGTALRGAHRVAALGFLFLLAVHKLVAD